MEGKMIFLSSLGGWKEQKRKKKKRKKTKKKENAFV